MAPRIRTIKPELLSEHSTGTLPDSAWRLFVSLYMLADDDGRFPASAAYIAGVVFWGASSSPELVDADLAELQRRKLIVRYSANGARYGAILRWREKGSLTYQLINKYTASRLPAPDGSTSELLPEDSGTPTGGKGMDLEGNGNEGNGRGTEGTGAADAASSLDPESLRLARVLLDGIASASPGTKIARLSGEALDRKVKDWASDLDKLHRIDGIAWADIEATIEWCRADDFWAANVLSGKAVRKSYDSMLAQRSRPIKETALDVALRLAGGGSVGRAAPASAEDFAKDLENPHGWD